MTTSCLRGDRLGPTSKAQTQLATTIIIVFTWYVWVCRRRCRQGSFAALAHDLTKARLNTHEFQSFFTLDCCYEAILVREDYLGGLTCLTIEEGRVDKLYLTAMDLIIGRAQQLQELVE